MVESARAILVPAFAFAKMLRMLLRTLLLLPALFIATSPDNEFLEQWFATLSDPAEDCQSTLSSSSAEDSFPIFLVADDCSELDARWDYNFLNFLSQSKPKNGVFDGQGKIVLPLKVKRDFRPEHNNYKFGFRHNKCLKLFSNDVSSIQGNFVQDRLEGKVRVDFHSGGFMVAQTRDSSVVGAVRFFDDAHKLQNVTTFRKNHQDVCISRSAYQLYRFTTRESNRINRVYYTKDFSTVYKCQEEEKFLLRNCYEVTNMKANVLKCDIEIRDDDTSGEISGDEHMFDWNLALDLKHFRNDPIYPDCSEEWTSDNVAEQLGSWFKGLADVSTDPFWRRGNYDEDDITPIDKSDLTVSFKVPEYNGRDLLQRSSPVNVTTLENESFGASGNWDDGYVTLRVQQDSTDNPNWSRLLKFDFSGGGEAFSSAGIFYGLENEQLRFGMLARIRRGRLHGHVRRFGRAVTDPKHVCGSRLFRGLSYVGRYQEGLPSIGAAAWRGVVGDGFLYGVPDEKGQFTGDDITFIYPDFKTALRGRFVNGVMMKGRRAEVVAVRCKDGIKEIKFSDPSGPMFYHDLPTHSSYGDQPLLTDPLDETYVEVRESNVAHEMADEGAFAKRDIPAGTVITLYSGLVFKDDEIEVFNKAAKEQFDQPDDPDIWKVTKYHGSVQECKFTITIPHQLGSLNHYRAALGHKLNHSFRPNCEYGGILDSPRFGLVRAFYTNRAIQKGEELFISYGYPVATGPPWYKEMHDKIMKEHGVGGFSKHVLSELEEKEKKESAKNADTNL